MIYLKEVIVNSKIHDLHGHPFDLKIIKNLKKISFHKQITILVGENGSGKTTLLEAIADGASAISVSGRNLSTDPLMDKARLLSAQLKYVWNLKTRKGLFLRAVDFYEYARNTYELETEYKNMAEDFSKELTGDGRDRAVGMALNSSRSFREKYEGRLTEKSHGESFLDFFKNRIRGEGLYFLDEPEVPLSPMRQLALISLIKDAAEQGAQFICATHSPLLMAIPDATIYQLNESEGLVEMSYDDLEHVSFYRNFLKAPDRYLKHL